MFIIHPETQKTYLEFVAKLAEGRKTSYIVQSEAQNRIGRDLPDLDPTDLVKLKSGIAEKILLYLCLRGMIFEVSHASERIPDQKPVAKP
jgi:hypothetical protein